MSAWIVGNESINNLVNKIYWFKDNFGQIETELKKLGFDLHSIVEDEDLKKELERLGQKLVNLNQFSICERYEQEDNPYKFNFSFIKGKHLSIYQFLKSVECLAYQSCEGRAEQDKLYKFLIRLEEILKNQIISEIEEYKNAKWE